jgi:beta-mannosidase
VGSPVRCVDDHDRGLMLQRHELHGHWRLQLVNPSADAPLPTVDVAAVVPGCVHTDLMAAGLLDDPYVDRRESEQHWIGRSDWRYATSFDLASSDDRVDLLFHGLDTIATVSIDGRVVGESHNMHRSLRIGIDDLSAGHHELQVLFRAPTVYAETQRDRLGDLPNPYGMPYNFIRKMACNFGWDWGPTLTTSGIWRPVHIESWSVARLAAVRPSIDVLDDGMGIVEVGIDIERADGDHELTIVAGIADLTRTVTVAPGALSATLRIEVPGAQRWWPAGRGEQRLYDLVVGIVDADGQLLDERTRRIGFRTITVDTSADDSGAHWAIVVNGERLWVRGCNWIPDDCFPTRVDRARYAQRLDDAIDAHCNLLRVWGGGIYESDEFYDLCDERGILVWQDFLFACAAYPEDALRDEVAAEATEQVTRLMSHPSLALWCGNNENLWGWHDWGWQQSIGDRPWGWGLYTDVLPGVIAACDPTRLYIPGSPYSTDPMAHPNDERSGPVHVWDVWNDLDYTEYRSKNPRFVSEFGFQAPPTWATLCEGVSTRPLALGDPNLDHHQKAHDGHGKLARRLAEHFDPAVDIHEWLFLTQLNQARAIEVGIGHFRALHDRCAGAIWWQLNDCWPVVSWSVVDGAGRYKPSWYALRRAFDDRCVVIRPGVDGATVTLVNDSRLRWADTLRLRRIDAHGQVLAELVGDVAVDADGHLHLPLPGDVGVCVNPTTELLVADIGARRASFTWLADKDLRLPPAQWQATTSFDDDLDVVVVDVVASSVVRDLCLFADRVDPAAQVDDMLVTLLPGERHRFTIHGTVSGDTARFAAPTVLRSAPSGHTHP